MDESDKLISVVIPARNEEKTISECIESIIAALDNSFEYEIILVDSDSTDHTIEYAMKYPIRIIKLRKEWELSPSAGRFIGTVFSRGQYIFFVDADMIIEKNWIIEALKQFEKSTSIAGVGGIIYNITNMNDKTNPRRLNRKIGNVKYIAGPAIYKKSILQEVGNVNPFLRGCVERELGYRIGKKGYNQIRLNERICYHVQKAQSMNEIKEKTSYYRGIGQFIRLHFTIQNIFEMLWTYKRNLINGIIIAAYALSILLSFFFNKLYTLLIVLGTILFLIVLSTKKKHVIKKIWFLVCISFLSQFNFFIGFFRQKRKPDEYPTNVEIIK